MKLKLKLRSLAITMVWTWLLVATWLCLMLKGQEAELRGVVDLDFLTFDKIVDGTKNVLVRFDDVCKLQKKRNALY